MASIRVRDAAPASAQKQFIRQCVAHGYAEFDEKTLRLTPAGMVVQNSILTELM